MSQKTKSAASSRKKIEGQPTKRTIQSSSSESIKRSRSDGEFGDNFEDDLEMMDTMENDEDAADGIEDLELGVIEAGSESASYINPRWLRPALPPINPRETSIIMQWIDIDMTSGAPLDHNPNGQGAMPGCQDGPVPIIRLYGVTETGNSVTLFCHGFTPYFYVNLPHNYRMTPSMISSFRLALDCKSREKRKASGDEAKLKVNIPAIDVIHDYNSLLGYHFGESHDFLKIYVSLPSMVPSVRGIFDSGSIILPDQPDNFRWTTFESNVPFLLRFMIDCQISGSDWLEVLAGSYLIKSDVSSSSSSSTDIGNLPRRSRCQLEIDVAYNSLIVHKSEGEWSKIAPFRILSFDIECQGREGHFPEADQDPIIQISNVVALQGSYLPDAWSVKNVFTLGTCLPIAGAQVISNSTEAEMLMKWKAFVHAIDPDIVTGYNIANFDIPYILNRAKSLSTSSRSLRSFPELGRIIGAPTFMKSTTFQSSAYGKRESMETTIHGRIVFDCLPYMFRNHKLSSYSLNSVSAEFLGQQKEDVHYSIISRLQNGTDADRKRLAVYCIKDAYLPQKLLEKLAVIVNYIEMARVTGVPLSYILTRGQQIKVMSMLLRKCRLTNLLIPNVPRGHRQGAGGAMDGAGYEGATVIEPEKGYYDGPIATLDFTSLYPSIMQAYNLCYSTLVDPMQMPRFDDAVLSTHRSPTGHIFINSDIQRGILPQILDELLAARKRAKKDMAKATDPLEKAVQNGRQLALKVSANSVYGFTGATVGQLPCIPIAASVTSYGRDLLFSSRRLVEDRFSIANGFPANAHVIYGDTDSVMVNFGMSTVAETMPLAQQAAAEVTQLFPRPISLEFEKIYHPYLLMNKKRYAGLLWTNPNAFDKMDMKGLETVRRDNCVLVRKVVDTCLRKILIERSVDGAIDYAKGVVSDLLQDKIDVSMLVISKSLGKSADSDDYSNKQAHVELAMRMKKRDPGSAPHVGDRVPYVVIQAAKGTPLYDKSEDPVYVVDNGLPIDTEYYMKQQLLNPLSRIFEPVMENPESQLFSGDHTRHVHKSSPALGSSAANIGKITTFAVRKNKCLGCKIPLSESEVAASRSAGLCTHCVVNESSHYVKKLQLVNQQQTVFSRLWTECQRCQGFTHQEVLCTNRDCPIFYRRMKVQKDLKEAQDALDRFTW